MASSDAERTVVAYLFENLMKLSRGEDGRHPAGLRRRQILHRGGQPGRHRDLYLHPAAERPLSDGQTVTAHDFVYAWQRLADPATGSPHAALLDMVAGI